MDRVYSTRDKDDVLTGGRTITKSAPDGREIARIGYDPSGQETFHQVISYKDATEPETVVLTFRPDGSLMQKGVSRYNQNGDLIEMTTMNSDGQIIDRQTYTYTSESVHYSRFGENQELIETWSRRII